MEIVEQLSLKEQLDKIDEDVSGDVWEKFYEGKLRILLGMWEKGRVVTYSRLEVTSFRQLEKETGRSRQHLKKWHDIFKKYPDRDKYIAIAEEKAETWTNGVFKKQKALPKPETPPLPDDIYNIIYADPPWKYSDELIEGYGAAAHHYPQMSIEELSELKIKDISDKNSVLFLWVTSPFLDECWPIIRAWGFKYKSSFVWDKIKHNYGHYNSVRHELLLICTRGSFLPQNKILQDSVISIERSEKHSEKPELFRNIIDGMYPHGKRIELFARIELPEHWDGWGNEI